MLDKRIEAMGAEGEETTTNGAFKVVTLFLFFSA
jgi:hypothetical protein